MRGRVRLDQHEPRSHERDDDTDRRAPDDERSKVESWRLHVLIEAGYPLSLAERLAVSEADLHTAVEMIEQRLRARDGRRDPALAATVGAPSTLRRGEGRGAPVRRPHRLLGRVVQRGVARWLARLPTRLGRGRGDRAAPARALGERLLHAQGSRPTAPASASRCRAGSSTRSRLDLENGERVHVFGRPSSTSSAASFKLRALTIERFGLGAHLAALERLKAKLAAEGLFAAERKRPLPLLPRRIGIVTGNDAAAKRDVVTTIHDALPARARRRRRDVRPGAARGARRSSTAIDALCAQPDVDVDRPHARRRQLRGSAPVQRRARRPRRRRVPRAGRLRGRPRAGHAALRPRRRRPRLDADRRRQARRPRPRLSCAARSTARARRSRAASGASLERDRERLDAHRRPAARWRAGCSALERKRAPRSSTLAAKLASRLSPRATLDRGYAIVRTESRARPLERRRRAPAIASRSRSPTAPSARASRT